MKALFILLLACSIFGTAGYYAYELFVGPRLELQREREAPPTPAPDDPTVADFRKAAAFADKGQLVEARQALQDFIERYPESTAIEMARDTLGDANTRIFLSPVPAPEKQLYIVKSGDVLNRVAAQTKTTAELLMKANDLSGTMLRIGQKLYTTPASFSVVISRKRSKITVLNEGRFFKQYPVREWPPALLAKKGAPAKQAGKVIDKIAWHDGLRVIFSDPGYASATHWININIGHCTLYGEPPPDLDKKKLSKPPSGIAIAPEAAVELATMLRRGDPVTLE